MAITVDQITALVGRHTNSVVNEQVNLECPVIGEGVIKKLHKPEKLGVINVKASGLSATGWLADSGTLPTASNVTPAQGTYQPRALLTHLAIPRMAAQLASSEEDGILLVKEQMESAGKDLGRQLGRSVFGDKIYTLGAADDVDASADATITVSNPAGFRPGMKFTVYNGSSLVESAIVTDVSIPTSGNSTITLSANAGGAWVAGYDLYLFGAKVDGMVGLDDVCAAANLYGITYTTNDFSGNLDSSTTTLTASALKALSVRCARRSGKKPSHVLLNSVGEQRLYESMGDAIRFSPGGKVDDYGAKLMFDGRPVIVDENCGDSDVYLIDSDNVKLHVFRDINPEMHGAKKPGMGQGALLVSTSTLDYNAQIWGSFNLRCEKRNGFGRMSGLTA
ncbi:MAG: hypothetical protein VW405_01650 [Rhodospirillaceae bacterium]